MPNKFSALSNSPHSLKTRYKMSCSQMRRKLYSSELWNHNQITMHSIPPVKCSTYNTEVRAKSLWDRRYRGRGLVRAQWNTLRPRLLAREREDAGSNPSLDRTVIPPLSHYRLHPLPSLPILHTGSSPWDDRKNCRRECHGHTHVNDPTAGETPSWRELYDSTTDLRDS